MDMEVVEVDGFYMSSSLPKALYVPARTKLRNQRVSSYNTEVLYLKAENNAVQLRKEITNASKTILPILGRQNLSIQTDLYLEELCDVIDVADAETETDPLLDRPTSPLFVPAKSGVDAETQIYPGELFDFDEEVEPLLEALVGQTLEQALIEIMAEEELAAISDLQENFEAKRNAELAELKRLEEQERRIIEERKKRLEEQEQAIKLEDEMAQKVAASVFSQNYLSQLVPQVYRKLESEGYFETEDPEVKEIEEEFWPWLLSEVDSEISTLEVSYNLLDNLIADAIQDIQETSVIKPVGIHQIQSDSAVSISKEQQESSEQVIEEDAENINDVESVHDEENVSDFDENEADVESESKEDAGEVN